MTSLWVFSLYELVYTLVIINMWLNFSVFVGMDPSSFAALVLLLVCQLQAERFGYNAAIGSELSGNT